ncbi:MAG: YqaJ viral recombinase family protein [Comamonas sp.]|nr:YqaJ viral recombinase family protein [Comamonas sp.]
MQIVNLIQGTPEWHAHRAKHFNASDASAMMGCSSYKSRSQLIKELATGLGQEVDASTQRRFDDGHRFEALARPLAEKIIGDDEGLSACVGVRGKYSASFDGLTFMYDVAFEHKTLNKALRAAMVEGCTGADLPLQYKVQMEHQAMVSGCDRILFMASEWAGDGQLVEERHCWYYPNPELRAQIIAGWEQLEKDVAAYDPTAERPAPAVAAPMESLPAVVVQVQGQLTVGGNLPAFGAALRAFIERIPAKPSTDQEFADADAACKALKKAEDALAQAEESALAQVGDVEAMRRMVADLKALARATRLATEKLVKAEKEARRVEIVTNAKMAFNTHVQRLEVELKGIRLQIAPPDFAGAIKGLSSVSSMEEKLTAALLEGKAQANTLASRVADNLRMLDSVSEYAFLFPDRQDLANKDSEVLELLIHKRVADHQAAEAARLEAERERIRAEEAAKLHAQAAIEAAAKTEAPSAQPEPVAEAKAPETVVQQAQAAPANEAADDGDTLTLGQINSLIAPLKVDAAGLAELGFEARKVEKSTAKHYRTSDLPAIVQTLVTHLQGVLATA